MPALAIYIGAHDVTGLVYVNPQESYYYNFPYVYSTYLFHSSISESNFYKTLFEYFCKQSKVKLNDCDVMITGFLEPPELNIKLKYYVSLFELLRRIESYYPILINNYGVMTSEQLYSLKVKLKDGVPLVEPDEDTFYANLCIYPQLTITDIVSRADLDQNIIAMTKTMQLNLPRSKQIVFMGSRFNAYNSTHELNHLLIMDILRAPGIYQVYIDPLNTFILTQLIKSCYGNTVEASPNPIKVGTLISAKNNLECMVSTQVGTSQIIDLEKNKVFVLPLAKEERAKIVLKVVGSNTVEEYVSGGTLGLIFDTRESKEDLVGDFKSFNTSLKVIGNAGNI